MGVSISNLFNLKDTDYYPIPEMIELTEKQISIIKETWKIPAANVFDSGEIILLKFFELYPENQNYFAAFKNTPLLSLKGTPGFRTHAARIMNVFGQTIKNLGDVTLSENIEKIWLEVGESHSKRNIHKKSFFELRGVVLQVLTEVCKLDEEQQIAWTILLDNAYHIVYTILDRVEGDGK